MDPRILEYLKRKAGLQPTPAPVGPSAFDVASSTSTVRTGSSEPLAPVDPASLPPPVEPLSVSAAAPVAPVIPTAPQPATKTVAPAPVESLAPTITSASPDLAAERQALLDSQKSGSDIGVLAKFGAGIGDAIARTSGDASVATTYAKDTGAAAERAKAKELSNFDSQTEFARKAKLDSREDAAHASKADPNSKLSKSYQLLAKTIDPKGNFEGQSAAQLEEIVKPLMQKYGIDEKSENMRQSREILRQNKEDRSNERISKVRKDIIDKFNGDQSVKKAQTSLDAARTIRDLANSGNPIGAAAIPTYSARMAGEVGALSEADKRPFGGSQAIVSRVDAALKQMADGRLTPENKRYIIALTEVVEKRAAENMNALAKLRSQQYGTLKTYGSAEEIYGALRPEIESQLTIKPAADVDPATMTQLQSALPKGAKVMKVTRVQ